MTPREKKNSWSSYCGAAEINPTVIHGGCRFDPWLSSVGHRSGIAMNCGVGHRHGLDPTLLWLWRRPAAVAPIGPLAWEPPYVMGTALKRQKTKKERMK